MSRIVVWFSCGAASACAAKLAKDKYLGQDLHIVYCNTLASEHPDNQRFLQDIEQWIDLPVELIASKKYSDIDDVFAKTRYMAGISGARCTLEMKRLPRLDYQRPDDIHIFGYLVEEHKRILTFEKNNPELDLDWILVENGMTRQHCYTMLQSSGIALPIMYSLGFKNNNCIGCVKATSSKYWNRVRQHFPAIFEKRAKQSRELGAHLVYWKGKRIFLDELPLINDNAPEEDIECGPICMLPNIEQGGLF